MDLKETIQDVASKLEAIANSFRTRTLSDRSTISDAANAAFFSSAAAYIRKAPVCDTEPVVLQEHQKQLKYVSSWLRNEFSPPIKNNIPSVSQNNENDRQRACVAAIAAVGVAYSYSHAEMAPPFSIEPRAFVFIKD
jgi:hypothetical protein